MAFLRRVSDFWNSMSPRKTQEKRDKPFKVPAIPVRTAPLSKNLVKSEARSMSPEARFRTWGVQTPSPQSNGDPDRTLLPPSPPASAQAAYEDFEGETLVPTSPSVQQSVKTTGSSANERDANDSTMVLDDGKYMTTTFDVEKEIQRREAQGAELRASGWSEDAVFLFQKLGMRGLEPLLPIAWLDDLDTLPGDLFTAKDDKVFLRPTHGTEYHAQLALSNLFDLGGRVNDAWLTRARKRKAEVQIRRGVERYTRWAMKDGNVDDLWSQLPIFNIVTWPKSVHASTGEQEMIRKLSNLYDDWYEALDIEGAEERMDDVIPEVPTLYGVTASFKVMGLVSYAPPSEENPKPKLRLIGMFDFGKEGYDVWHSLAIAIFVTHCRNRLMQLKEHLPEQPPSLVEDPDV